MSISSADMINNMISWAMAHLEDESYAGWCLSFVHVFIESSKNHICQILVSLGDYPNSLSSLVMMR